MNTDIIIMDCKEIATAEASKSLIYGYIDFVDRTAKTAQTYITNIKQFFAWLRYEGITRPLRDDIKKWRSWLAAEHTAIKWSDCTEQGWEYQTDGKGGRLTARLKASTVSQYLRSVKSFFRWTASEGIYPNVADNLHAPKVSAESYRKESLDAEDVKRIYDSIQAADEQGKRLRAMFALTATAGLRTIELERANVGDLGIHGGRHYLYVHGKGHTQADTKVMLSARVYGIIKDYLDTRADGARANSPLFTATGNRSKGKRILARTISQMLKKAMVSAGYESDRLTAHSLRHTAGTTAMAESGKNLFVTQKYLRHASPNTTEIYLHTTTERDEADLAEKVTAAYGI